MSDFIKKLIVIGLKNNLYMLPVSTNRSTEECLLETNPKS
jgi:hypothetical protein